MEGFWRELRSNQKEDFIKALAQLEITYFDETSNDAYELFSNKIKILRNHAGKHIL